MLSLKPSDVEAYLAQQRVARQGKQAAVTALRQARSKWVVSMTMADGGGAADTAATATAGLTDAEDQQVSLRVRSDSDDSDDNGF